MEFERLGAFYLGKQYDVAAGERLDRLLMVERILEDESLTTDLVDYAAQMLLDWGVAQARATVRRSEDMPRAELDARLTTLRRTMKRINRRAGRVPPDVQARRVQTLLADLEQEQPDAEARHAV